jgi:O-acetyl-ADP-ribose deacetylase (regulator of RNase III)
MSNAPPDRNSEAEADRRHNQHMLPSKIYLIDRSPPLVHEWQTAFADCPEVRPLSGAYFQQAADAMVSPANSFGIMDGGLDLAIRDELGYSVEAKVQDAIVDQHHGELPVGSAVIVETGHSQWRYLIAAPTMRVPEPIAFTLNAYFAFRAILLSLKNFNSQAGRREIDSVVCSGLGTGVGQMSATKCARQMRAAYEMMRRPAAIRSFQHIHELHNSLRML